MGDSSFLSEHIVGKPVSFPFPIYAKAAEQGNQTNQLTSVRQTGHRGIESEEKQHESGIIRKFPPVAYP
jgi:hypothetical protein